MGRAIVIGSTVTVALNDHDAAVDSSLPAFHADPHRGAKHSRTMEATSQWQLQGCSSLLLNYSGDCTIVFRGTRHAPSHAAQGSISPGQGSHDDPRDTGAVTMPALLVPVECDR